MSYAFFKITDVQKRVPGMNDLLNIESVNESLKKVDHAWEETLLGTGEGTRRSPGRQDLLESLYRRLEKSTHMQNDHICAVSPRADSPQRADERTKEKSKVKAWAIPVAPVHNRGLGKEKVANNGC